MLLKQPRHVVDEANSCNAQGRATNTNAKEKCVDSVEAKACFTMPKVTDVNALIVEFGGKAVWNYNPMRRSLFCKLCSTSCPAGLASPSCNI